MGRDPTTDAADADAAETDPARPPVASVWRMTRFILRVLLKHPGLVTASLILSVCVAATEVVAVALLVPFLQALRGEPLGAFGGPPFSWVLPSLDAMSTTEIIRAVAVALVVTAAVRGVITFLSGRLQQYQKILLERDLRQMVFDELLRVELRFIHKERVGNLYTILHVYPRTAADIASQYFGSATRVVIFCTYVWILFQLSVPLTLIAATLGILSMVAIAGLRVTLRKLGRRLNESRASLNQVSLEALSAMKVIRLYGREETARRRFNDEVRELRRQSFRSASISAAAGPVQSVVYIGLVALLLVAGTLLLDRSDEEWIAILTLFMLVLARVLAPLSSLSKKQTKISSDLPALEEILAFMERKDKTYLVDGTVEFPGLREAVRFEGVTFGYDPAQPVLRDVSISIPKGATVALVGSSGSGKSTCVNLLARLADPDQGRILVDGVDLRTFRGNSWRRRIAVVSQETFLFNASVRENIRYGREDATDAEVEAAARKANAHDFIIGMEDGYDTVVGDRGVRLSGGQAQRLSIARALLADPEILVLDEATSALDAETEQQVQAAIAEAARGRTVLVVAHRLSTVRKADEIVVLEKGEVVERGRHDDLLAQKGRYYDYTRLLDVGDAAPAV